MYLWKIEIVLKSGKTVAGYDKNEYDNSADVAEEFFGGSQDEIISLGNLQGTHNLLVKKDEIAAMVISAGEVE